MIFLFKYDEGCEVITKYTVPNKALDKATGFNLNFQEMFI